jgi:methylated-DNA-[protein]-cysteine S-methyltransferase
MASLLVDEISTPLGPVALASDGAALRALVFGPLASMIAALRDGFPAAALREASDPQGFSSLVRAYFGGAIHALEGLPADGGGTAFQRRVWLELRRIAPGETRSYGELAARLGVPGASRAVGLANARNPIALAVPCHRVIGSDGRLAGYAAGVERKRWLLAHEGALIA